MTPEEHRQLGIELYNRTWELLEGVDPGEAVHAAHASAYHWLHAAGASAANRARSDWLCSHVYAVLGRAEPSAYHAARCLAICRQGKLGGFALAFAFEASARAASIAGRTRDRDRFLRLARATGARIEESDDRKRFFSDLATIPRRARPRARA